MAIDVAAIKQAIRTAVSVASGLVLTKVIIPRQSDPRPVKPYITVDLQTSATPYTADLSKVESIVYDLTVLTTANGFVHFVKIGDTVFEHVATGLSTPTTVAAALIALVNASAIDVTGAVVAAGNYTLTSDDVDVPILVYADTRQEINSGDAQLSQLGMDITVGLLFYGETSYELATRTKHAIRLQSPHDTMADAGVALYRSGDVTPAPELLEDKWEERHSLDLFLNVISETTDESGTIESVEGTLTVTQDGQTVQTLDLDVTALG